MTDHKKLIEEARGEVCRKRYTAKEAKALALELADALEAATAEPEWEYRAKVEYHEGEETGWAPEHIRSPRPFTADEMAHAVACADEQMANLLEGAHLTGQERRRKAGLWLPVEGESA